MFKWWPLMWKIRHEREIRELKLEIHNHMQQVNADIQLLLWEKGQFRAERTLMQYYIGNLEKHNAHLESLVNEMQENQR